MPDRRLVVDGRVATTTGITASMPVALTVIEAIAGFDKAKAVAHDLGVEHWDARHDSAAFTFTRPFALAAIGNTMAFWNRERLGIDVQPGVDAVSLALVADAWSRTYRSRAVTLAEGPEPIQTRYGIRVVPDQVGGEGQAATRHMGPVLTAVPAVALDQTLDAIADRYGRATAAMVAMQLELPKSWE